MTVSDAVKQLLEIPKLRNLNKEETGKPTIPFAFPSLWKLVKLTCVCSIIAYDETTIAVGLARIGCDEQRIVCGTMKCLLSHDLGPPLHSLIIPGEMHFLEKEMLNEFAVDINTNENENKWHYLHYTFISQIIIFCAGWVIECKIIMVLYVLIRGIHTDKRIFFWR